MAASDESETDGRAKPMAGSDSGPVIDNQPAVPKNPSPIMRRLRLYGYLLLAVAVGLLGAAGSYPYWRAKAAGGLAFVGVEIDALELYFGVPRWAITHGRAVSEPISVPATEPEPPAPVPAPVIASTAPAPAPAPVMEEKSEESEAPPSAIVESEKPAAAIAVSQPPSETTETQADTTGRSSDIEAPTEPDWQPVLHALLNRMATVETRLTDVEDRLVVVEQVASEAAVAASEAIASAAASLAATSQASSVAATPVPVELVERLDGLVQRLASLEASQKETAEQVADAAPKAESAALIGTVVGLAERLAAIESRVPVDPEEVADLRGETSANAGRVEELDARMQAIVAKLEEGTPARDQAALVLLSVSQLAVATSGPAPFSVQLEALRSVAGADATLTVAIDQLAAHAETGAPTLAILKAGFADAASAAVRGRDIGAPEGMLGQTLSRVASLVTVRKIDDLGPGTVDGALAAAEAALATGDLPAAVVAVKSLEGAPAEAVAPWLAQAGARLSVDSALSELQAAVLAVLAAAG